MEQAWGDLSPSSAETPLDWHRVPGGALASGQVRRGRPTSASARAPGAASPPPGLGCGPPASLPTPWEPQWLRAGWHLVYTPCRACWGQWARLCGQHLAGLQVQLVQWQPCFRGGRRLAGPAAALRPVWVLPHSPSVAPLPSSETPWLRTTPWWPLVCELSFRQLFFFLQYLGSPRAMHPGEQEGNRQGAGRFSPDPGGGALTVRAPCAPHACLAMAAQLQRLLG